MDKNINIIDVLAQDALRRAFNVYGIEGTLEKIHELCKNVPAVKEVHLRNFNLLVKGE
ncbi:MAG: hypothetical protein ACOC1K_05690 [Nanoarchaeota archaeon]